MNHVNEIFESGMKAHRHSRFVDDFAGVRHDQRDAYNFMRFPVDDDLGNAIGLVGRSRTRNELQRNCATPAAEA